MSNNPFYGPNNQFWPHRAIWAILKGFFSSIMNTLLGLGYCIIHPRRSIRGIWFAVRHPGSTIQGIGSRMKSSLRRNGIFYTGTCAVCMFILPGAGLFGKVAELSEHGRKASALKVSGGAPGQPPPPVQQQPQQQYHSQQQPQPQPQPQQQHQHQQQLQYQQYQQSQQAPSGGCHGYQSYSAAPHAQAAI